MPPDQSHRFNQWSLVGQTIGVDIPFYQPKAVFIDQNEGALPEQNQFNISIVDRTELQINDLDFQLKELKKRKIRLEGELTQISPSAPTTLADGSVVLGDADRLRAVQSQLRQFKSIYH